MVFHSLHYISIIMVFKLFGVNRKCGGMFEGLIWCSFVPLQVRRYGRRKVLLNVLAYNKAMFVVYTGLMLLLLTGFDITQAGTTYISVVTVSNITLTHLLGVVAFVRSRPTLWIDPTNFSETFQD